jgi:hypothetical protein
VIRRLSLVRKRPELSSEEFIARWSGEHVELARRLQIAARLAAVEHPPKRYPTGVLAKYARLVGSAATGARVGA